MKLQIKSLTIESDEIKYISSKIDKIVERVEVERNLFLLDDAEPTSDDYYVINNEIEWHIDDFIHYNQALTTNRQRAAGIVLTSALFPKFDWTNLSVDKVHSAREGDSYFRISDDKDVITENQYIGWVRKRLKDYGGIKPFITKTIYDIDVIVPWRTYAIDTLGLSMGYSIEHEVSIQIYTKFAEWYVTIYKAPLTPVKLIRYCAAFDEITPKEESVTYNGETFNFVFYRSK